MYLSRLTLNPRSRRVRRELQSPYELHRTLMTAFPNGDAGGPGRVLFRVDQSRRQVEPIVLVQSEKEPGWEQARTEWPGDYLTPDKPGAGSVDHKSYNPAFASGQVLHFRLRANPTVRRAGKRLGLLTEEKQAAWLHRQGERGGFQPVSVLIVPEGMVKTHKGRPGTGQALTWYAVRYEGALQVTDPANFLGSLRNGIGPAKAFGFGLLSVAPLVDT